MTLNKQKGNMYGFVTHTWNPIKGGCMHDCSYCYMKEIWARHPSFLHLDEKDIETKLEDKEHPKGIFIFVGSSTDMFEEHVPFEWIEDVLNKCNQNTDNRYLFQSKNPARFIEFVGQFPNNSILCTTIETNRSISSISSAPETMARARCLGAFSPKKYEKMVTIEPVLDFDVAELVVLIRIAKPNQVNIGADSKRHNLPEPSAEKVGELIKELRSHGFDVKLKSNLKRIYKE